MSADKTANPETAEEINFIEKIGTFSEPSYENRLSEQQLLINYYKAIKTRQVWGNIDREKVMQHMFQKIYCGDVV